jgi:hypothetical protein
MLLLKLPDWTTVSLVLLLAVVGLIAVFQQTPLAVMVAPPLVVIVPPEVAVVEAMLLAVAVAETVGAFAPDVKLVCAPYDVPTLLVA